MTNFLCIFFYLILKPEHHFLYKKIVWPRWEVRTPRLVSSKIKKALIIGVLLYFHHMWGGVIKKPNSEIHDETTHTKVLETQE
jgi:hypothetical protein